MRCILSGRPDSLCRSVCIYIRHIYRWSHTWPGEKRVINRGNSLRRSPLQAHRHKFRRRSYCPEDPNVCVIMGDNIGIRSKPLYSMVPLAYRAKCVTCARYYDFHRNIFEWVNGRRAFIHTQSLNFYKAGEDLPAVNYRKDIVDVLLMLLKRW